MPDKFRICVGIALNTVLVLIVVLGPAKFVQGTELRWPTKVVSGDLGPLTPWHALGRPNGDYAEFVSWDLSATYSSFAGVETIESAVLSALLGVSEEVLAGADIISFDYYGAAFEASTWTFTSEGVTHVVDAPGSALATGSISESAYMEFWGIAGEPVESDLVQFVLLGVGQLSGLADDFSVEVRSIGGAYGRPELDAIGLLCSGAVSVESRSFSHIKALYR